MTRRLEALRWKVMILGDCVLLAGAGSPAHRLVLQPPTSCPGTKIAFAAWVRPLAQVEDDLWDRRRSWATQLGRGRWLMRSCGHMLRVRDTRETVGCS